MCDEITITVADADQDNAALSTQVGDLQRRLVQLEVNEVSRLRSSQVPPNSRAMDVATVNSLLVCLSASVPLVREVIGVVVDWRRQHDSEASRVFMRWGDRTLELDRATGNERDRLIEAFLQGGRGSRTP